MSFKRFIQYGGKQSGRDNGFTLIEVLVAMTIFTIGILGVANMQISAIKGNFLARKITETATLGQEVVERIIALDYADAQLTDNNSNGYLGRTDGLNLADKIWQHKEDDPDSPYDVYSNIAENYPITDNKTIWIYVEWKAYGRKRSMFIDYMKAKTN